MTDIKDMQLDPEPLDTNDPEVLEEMFEQYHAHGLEPKDLPGMPEKLRKKYTDWLASK